VEEGPPALPADPQSKTREQALDFIRRTGTTGVDDWQLEQVHISIEVVDELVAAGEITFNSHVGRYYVADEAPDEAAQ
jgi:hypothetical protein